MGVIINTQNLTFKVPNEKIESLTTKILQVLSQKYTSAMQLAKIAGKLSSMHLSIGPLVRLFTRSLYCQIETRDSWYNSFKLNKEGRHELEFWCDNNQSGNGFYL